MRRVRYRLQEVRESMMDDEHGKEAGKLREGNFHQWGTRVVDLDGKNNGIITVAVIVEDDTGKTHLVYPGFVTFLD